MQLYREQSEELYTNLWRLYLMHFLSWQEKENFGAGVFIQSQIEVKESKSVQFQANANYLHSIEKRSKGPRKRENITSLSFALPSLWTGFLVWEIVREKERAKKTNERRDGEGVGKEGGERPRDGCGASSSSPAYARLAPLIYFLAFSPLQSLFTG